ncbi:hypothetical protein L596_005808 [Steinernema carpocapsae]|uniref:Potassium channel domain-containing protein n=1 Tax=Steinernema carpocapsae TaxID=34508 RepID=A0A4U8V1G0_STECR|nr:hypothetical protein L596_005808 [Steinernema carpocapsae]
MLLISQAPERITPYVVHLLVIFAVVLYVIGGAWTIRWIEAIEKQPQSGLHNAHHLNKSQPRFSATRVNHTTSAKASPAVLVTNEPSHPSMHRNRRCVIAAVHKINQITSCDPASIDKLIMKHVDDCYQDDLRELKDRAEREAFAGFATGQRQSHVTSSDSFHKKEHDLGNSFSWKCGATWMRSFFVLRSLPLLATVTLRLKPLGAAYSSLFTAVSESHWPCWPSQIWENSSPPFSNSGQNHFCCMETEHSAASAAVEKCAKRFRKSKKANSSKKVVLVNGDQACKQSVDFDSNMSPEDGMALPEGMEEDEDSVNDEFILLIAFFFYIMAGSFIISSYEPNMDFFKAVYFNFVTLTTIGLGDLVPQSETYLFFTLIYVAVGLALSTIGIEIAADYLKKLHYFGRKIEDVSKVQIWFGGKKLTMKQLVKNLGDQFNLPVEDIEDLNLDNFVDQAIKVEAGELPTLRQPTPDPKLKPIFAGDFTYDSESVVFADEDDLLTLQSYRKY